MKRAAAFLLTILCMYSIHAQDISGQWKGVLKSGAIQLRVAFNITKTETGFSSTMDSPDQGATGIPVNSTIFDNQKLRLEITAAKIEYSGVFKNDTLTGVFSQGGTQFPLTLSRGITKPLKRPQEPTKPYAYYSEEVVFKNNKANISLAGTLTLPEKAGSYPVVILISGSGPQNRDEEIFGHKPFLVLADQLTKNGIGVLRYDDRGVSKSQGNFNTAVLQDFVSDAESAIAYLKTRKEVDSKKIGLIGHSEGGIIAPIIAAKSSDLEFIVLLAGPGMQGDKLMLLQKESIERQMGYPEQAVLESQRIFQGAYQIILESAERDPTLPDKVRSYFKSKFGNQVPESQINTITKQLTNPWMEGLLKYNPIPVLQKVKCPVLALNGGNDLQVSARENLTGIKNALTTGGNKDVTTMEYPGLNHLFQECKACLPTEYSELEETFSPIVLAEMTEWIVNHTK